MMCGGEQAFAGGRVFASCCCWREALA